MITRWWCQWQPQISFSIRFSRMELSHALIQRFARMLCRRQCMLLIWALNWERAPMYFGVDAKVLIQRQAKIRLWQFNECEMPSISYVAMPLTAAIHFALL